ncbi:MAG: hypothetical protein M1481_00250 [Candidatus Thermoplasmatota archaeon]|nr:hypothetical protein [Candidatus Thermoplasmatota archaeon]MCL5963887.1 hypothetical protein [Candidatus Thermoplasmatota archaeon]
MSKTITISIDEEINQEFRATAEKLYGRKKGYIRKALTEAIKQWLQEKNTEVVVSSIGILKEGIKMKSWKFSRDDLHER